jgi:hypothetical protein
MVPVTDAALRDGTTSSHIALGSRPGERRRLDSGQARGWLRCGSHPPIPGGQLRASAASCATSRAKRWATRFEGPLGNDHGLISPTPGTDQPVYASQCEGRHARRLPYQAKPRRRRTSTSGTATRRRQQTLPRRDVVQPQPNGLFLIQSSAFFPRSRVGNNPRRQCPQLSATTEPT